MKISAVSVALMMFAAGLSGCGSSRSGPKQLSIQLSPSAPTLAVNTSVAIGAQTTPALPKYYGYLTWTVQGYNGCSEAVGDPTVAPPMPGCPNGWLAYEFPMTGYTTTGAYYYAPAVPGNYTVVVQGQIHNQLSWQKIDYQGSANAVVTVTAH